MKKLLLLAVLGGIALSFTSCSSDNGTRQANTQSTTTASSTGYRK